MATKISWTNETWNFLGGCSPCSEGCKNCVAARLASGRLKNLPLYKGLTQNGQWTGEVRLCTDIGRQDILEQPLHWKKPRMIFPCFMGDLFSKKVPFDFIDKVAMAMSLADQHTYQILTKRPERALACYTRWIKNPNANNLFRSNVWLGSSVSNQPDADRIIPILLQIPAAVRFVSLEPLLGPVNYANTEPKEFWCPECEEFSDCPEEYLCEWCSKSSSDSPENSSHSGHQNSFGSVLA